VSSRRAITLRGAGDRGSLGPVLNCLSSLPVLCMTTQRVSKRTEPPAAPAPKVTGRVIVANPPQRRRWLLILSAVAVLLWTLFLAWMAWVS
jgi:hypothetical protein